MKGAGTGIFFAVLAAALYAINSPVSKLLLDYLPPTLMAGFLYVGAGLGMGAVALVRKAETGRRRVSFRRSDAHTDKESAARPWAARRPKFFCEGVSLFWVRGTGA